ncbi:16S rRNA (guanine(966)-N(2))-methyltransferase RsmD [Thiomicrorhabdus heinhorstiae]|uniref:Ribosomal RNA small subunit methyltransferase D n=1 Tax=Thiomicrorhabdus heinhorstiae TaxID=2748010 RepID=A0ABS0C011_9GAMM|nr:16S rRNA (guanine(966)-N(2))-methyltransferase RsmD [Thiomicrorhabdus heinhorstiae]MBF6057586.1 16S rRNA (guanine(966)-N(2))-methyltransferase RsmD [Thiomicrorhabdus heinhorstiae]
MKQKRKTPVRRGAAVKSGDVGEVRIIGGDWGGRKLPVLQAEGLRPTSDRVRETLFNWLQFEVPGARCLDLFAGSGALGFEALSRGAKSCCFLELSAENTRQLQANRQSLQADQAEIHQTDSVQWIQQQSSQAFDIVFIDPPFHKGLLEPVWQGLLQNGWLAEEAWIYLEQENGLDWPEIPESCSLYREKKTSQVKYALFHYQARQAESRI